MKLKIKLLLIMIIINDKYITTQTFYKLTSGIFGDFVKKTYFNDKLKNLNEKVISNKTRQIEINTEIDDLENKLKVI